MSFLRRTALDRSFTGLRLDQALERVVPEVSRSRLQKWVRKGRVRLDGKVVVRSNGRVSPGATIEVELDPPTLSVLHEDEHLLVLDKPAGLLTHGIAGQPELSLADLAEERFGPLPISAGEHRPGIVHRLDRGTSGVIVLARDEPTLQELKTAFRERRVGKRYLALCWGTPPATRFTIDRPLGPSPGGDREWIDPPDGGRPAETTFEVLRRAGELSWIEARPRTGRRHQVRLHLVAAGLGVVADPLYGAEFRPTNPPECSRLALHAQGIELPEAGSFEAPLPDDLRACLATLGWDAADD